MNNYSNDEKSRRIVSGILDFILIYIVSVLLFVIYSNVYLEKNEKYQAAWQTQVDIIEDSSLYKNTGNSWELIDENYDQHLIEFYEKYDYDVTSGNASYNDAKEKSGYFINGQLKEQFDENDEGVRDFFATEMVLAVNVLSNNSKLQSALSVTDRLNTIGTDISFFASTLVFVFIIPLCNKRKQSIGKIVTKLELASKHGNKVHWVQLFIRFLVIAVVVVYFSIILPGVFLIIDTGFILFSKKGVAIEDLFADTYVRRIGSEEEVNEVIVDEKEN